MYELDVYPDNRASSTVPTGAAATVRFDLATLLAILEPRQIRSITFPRCSARREVLFLCR